MARDKAQASDPQLHPLVRFLVKRCASHPEEFEPTGVWSSAVMAALTYGTEREKVVLREALRPVVLGLCYTRAMGKMLHSDEGVAA